MDMMCLCTHKAARWLGMHFFIGLCGVGMVRHLWLSGQVHGVWDVGFQACAISLAAATRP